MPTNAAGTVVGSGTWWPMVVANLITSRKDRTGYHFNITPTGRTALYAAIGDPHTRSDGNATPAAQTSAAPPVGVLAAMYLASDRLTRGLRTCHYEAARIGLDQALAAVAELLRVADAVIEADDEALDALQQIGLAPDVASALTEELRAAVKRCRELP